MEYEVKRGVLRLNKALARQLIAKDLLTRTYSPLGIVALRIIINNCEAHLKNAGEYKDVGGGS